MLEYLKRNAADLLDEQLRRQIPRCEKAISWTLRLLRVKYSAEMNLLFHILLTLKFTLLYIYSEQANESVPCRVDWIKASQGFLSRCDRSPSILANAGLTATTSVRCDAFEGTPPFLLKRSGPREGQGSGAEQHSWS